MFDYPNKSEPMFQFSVKLCSAVKKHECLYILKVPTPNIPTEVAWNEVAEECGEPVENCKWRWKNLRRSFLRSLKRTDNKYYLHKYMEFLIPHLPLNDQTANGEGKNNENLGEDEYNAESDSDTTSADETHILKAEINKKLQDELPPSSQTVSKSVCEGEKNIDQVGDFVINEIDEGANANNNDDPDYDDDMNESVDTIRNRSRYTRACKRGLDPELANELNTVEKQEEKRPRRSVERRKDLSDVALEEISNSQRKSLKNAKKIEVKVNRIKFNKTLSTQPKYVEPQPVIESIAVNTVTSANTYYPKNSQENLNYLSELPSTTNHIKTSLNSLYDSNLNLPKKSLMVDMATITDLQTKDSSTQYESSEQVSLDFDDTFINSLKPQLKLMNGRQKMNFKRKVFHSLMEVFDDAANFPNTDEYIVLPSTGAPRFDSTTTGELRLMRELVSLVQAAKTTPEIVKATEKVTAGKPSTPQITEAAKTSSPFLMSPTFDDDDLSFLNGSLNDDKESLPSSLEDIIDLRNQDDVLGLPRRIIHKVVKVAGSNGSTIVTGEGKQRRVYRIYPKAANVEANRATTNKNNATTTTAASTGTFYVTPSKINSSATTSTDANRPKNNTPNFTFRAVNKSSNNNSRDTFVATNTINRSLHNANAAAANKTPNPPKGRVTPILNQATGLFTIPTPASKTPTSTNNQTKSPMLPPSVSSALFSNSNTNNSSMRIVSVKSNTNSAEANKTQNNIMQRRYSICGPATSVTKPMPVLPNSQTKPFIQKITYSSNGNPIKSAVSNIMISKPVSLKPSSSNSLTNVKTFLANTSKNGSSPITATNATKKGIEPIPLNEEKSVSTTKTDTTKTPKESPQPTKKPLPEVPILETAGTIAADTFNDPLYVNPTNKSDDPLCVKTTIKSEPLDD